MTDVHTDSNRLWSRLMEMAAVGATPAGGSNRQALSDDDKAGRELFIGWAERAGCSIELDGVGNLFARRPGTDPDASPVVLGSHLDTQPTGGRFDGVYGVLGGLEVVEALNDHEVQTRAPVEVAVWTNEEGSRFAVSMMGSSVWAGVMDLESVRTLTDRSGISVGDERIGSGAGHDACHVALRAPTGMIFVPCQDGLSHNEAESIEPDAAGRGAEVLLHATLDLAGTAS